MKRALLMFSPSILSLAVVLSASPLTTFAEAPTPPNRPPDAVVDLATSKGVRLVDAKWRYSDTRIVEADFRSPDAEGQPTGAPIKTYDYEPHAGSADFDDSNWTVIAPETLKERRS